MLNYFTRLKRFLIDLKEQQQQLMSVISLLNEKLDVNTGRLDKITSQIELLERDVER